MANRPRPSRATTQNLPEWSSSSTHPEPVTCSDSNTRIDEPSGNSSSKRHFIHQQLPSPRDPGYVCPHQTYQDRWEKYHQLFARKKVPESRSGSQHGQISSTRGARTAAHGPKALESGQRRLPEVNWVASQGRVTAEPFKLVLEYLNKKGYAKTESMLRRESAHQDPEGKPVFQKLEEEGGNKYFRSFNLIKGWVLDDNLEIYKGELLRLLWPTFAYCLLDLVADYYPRDAEKFFETYHEMFTREHSEDLRALSRITLPEHIQASEIAKLYRNNKYRLSITMMAFHSLLQFLESHLEEGGKIIMNIMQSHMNIMTIDRAKASSEYSISAMLHRGSTEQEMPAEDEGIPGHHPGSANTSLNAPEVLPKVQLGPAQRESDLMEDVRADLEKEDAKNPPVAGRNTLVEELEKTIKREPDDDTPNRDAVPLPPSTQRDVMMEVQKIKENRDRFPIPGRTGGVGPGVSVVMHTFHNTFD
ncbi:MAG: hypothetical protein Q9157_002989, partial [Trypethelium eluteriae]